MPRGRHLARPAAWTSHRPLRCLRASRIAAFLKRPHAADDKDRGHGLGRGFPVPLHAGSAAGGAPRASGTVHAVGSLLAVSLLVGVLRRAPLPALALTLFGSTAVVVFTPASAHADQTVSYQGQFLSYLAVDLVLGFIVATRTRHVSVIAVSVSLVVQLLLIGGYAHGDNVTVNAVIAVLAMSASCMIGLLSRERREHASALRSQEVAEAVTAERLRIARELHNMIAHSIGIIAIQAGMGSRVIQTQPAEAREALRAIEATSRETLSGLRRTLVALRQVLRDLGRDPLPVVVDLVDREARELRPGGAAPGVDGVVGRGAADVPDVAGAGDVHADAAGARGDGAGGEEPGRVVAGVAAVPGHRDRAELAVAAVGRVAAGRGRPLVVVVGDPGRAMLAVRDAGARAVRARVGGELLDGSGFDGGSRRRSSGSGLGAGPRLGGYLVALGG
ncbi:sensor histidine kinase [Streptomyces sp. NPDC058240]|uniref:sensor histidine kinase n=1 Tax=Streptomyces sp. NPDC058240 TaxID=3346396 RepID=UPI0036EC73DB